MEHFLGKPSVRSQNNLTKFSKTEITPTILSEYNDMKLEINYRKNIGKFLIYED